MNTLLNVLVVTVNDRVENLEKRLPIIDRVFYTISHQDCDLLSKVSQDTVSLLCLRNDINYVKNKTIGVGSNRNNAIRNRVPASYYLFADDDLCYNENWYNIIVDVAKQHSNYDVFVFMLNSPDNNPLKKYPFSERVLRFSNLTWIGAPEICVSKNFFYQYNIFFDERFGPGSEYHVGEDFIFITDAYKAGAIIYFFPFPIATHSHSSTGTNKSKSIAYGRGAMFARVFGWKSVIVDIIFAVKKRSMFKNDINVLNHIRLLVFGSLSYIFKFSKVQR